MNRVLVTAALVIIGGIAFAAQEEGSVWEVPDEARAVENPVEHSDEAVAAGEALFQKHCKMCHGDAGKGDGPATQFIKPAPPDFTGADARERMTDGEIFYKITTGKRPMPSMQRKMSDDERWQVVHFVRKLQAE